MEIDKTALIILLVSISLCLLLIVACIVAFMYKSKESFTGESLRDNNDDMADRYFDIRANEPPQANEIGFPSIARPSLVDETDDNEFELELPMMEGNAKGEKTSFTNNMQDNMDKYNVAKVLNDPSLLIETKLIDDKSGHVIHNFERAHNYDGFSSVQAKRAEIDLEVKRAEDTLSSKLYKRNQNKL